MNITKENIDELNAVIRIKIEKEDYEERLNNMLSDFRRKARIDGFRPGKVPFGMISKMYRKPALMEEINKILSESITKYLVDEKLNILGDPLPNEQEQSQIDWDNQTEFNFVFDIGLAPEPDISISAKEKIPFYTVKIDDQIRSKYIENYQSRMGSFRDIGVTEEKAMIKADLLQLDSEGNIAEGGIKVDEASISLELVKDEKIKTSLLGRVVNDVLSIDLKKAYPNNVDLSALLKIEKEKVAELNGNFQLKIKSISKFEKAEVNQEFYDKLYGKDAVKSEEEFKQRLDEDIKINMNRDSEYKLRLDIRNTYLNKFRKNLPEEFLKRWLLAINKDKYTEEQIDKDFEHFAEDLKWQLIKNKIIKENDIKVTEEEILQYVKDYARMQFAQYYGLTNVSEDDLIKYANELLKKDKEKKQFYERKYEDKVIEFVRNTVKIENKAVSSEKFNKLLEKQ
ncbi:MAG: trigger factor [Bacteroidales bacterium]|nr:MAG: trigger factor [Bacteroidales bacterium]